MGDGSRAMPYFNTTEDNEKGGGSLGFFGEDEIDFWFGFLF
jgi:hypothetical protein